MGGDKLDNEAPKVFESSKERDITDADFDDEVEDPIDQREIFGESIFFYFFFLFFSVFELASTHTDDSMCRVFTDRVSFGRRFSAKH
jgi:hypothetical protein